MRSSRLIPFLTALVASSLAISAVEITSTEHLGREHWKITTEAATYLFDPIAGGFSSIMDRAGNDWVAYDDPASADYPAGAAFGYRGVPNMVFQGDDNGAGHPGFDQCDSEIISPNQIRSRTYSGKYEWIWTFEEDHARQSVTKVDPDRAYWFLYEGPVGGTYDPDSTIWGSDLAGPSREHPDFYKGGTRFENYHWLYFASDHADQTFWIAQVEPDEQLDLYGQLGNTTDGLHSPDGMVVTGFGRGKNTDPLLRTPQEFLIGFWDGRVTRTDEHEAISQHINEAIETARNAAPAISWSTSSPAAEGLDEAAFSAALKVLKDYSGTDGLSEAFIVRHGKVVFAGTNTNHSHNIYSCTKSLTSTVLGLLIADGKCTLATRAANWEPALAALYPDVTLRDFATMTSGYSAAGHSRWNEDSEDWSMTPYEPIAPCFAPGTAYAYWDEAMMMFGRVLTKIAGEDLKSYLDDRLMSPIGIAPDDWDWWYDTELPDGTPIRNGCTGIALTAEQLARVGLLFLHDGVWNGKRVLPAGWVNLATATQVPSELPIGATDRANVLGNGRYGFNWWVRGDVGDMEDTPHGTYYMSGLHNNMCFVVPEWNMVIVRRGEDGNPPEGKRFVYNAFFRALGSAIDS